MEIALYVISSVLFLLFLLQSGYAYPRLCILVVRQQRLRDIDLRYFAVSPLGERHPVLVYGGCSLEDPPFALIIWNIVLLFSIDDEIEKFLRCVRLRPNGLSLLISQLQFYLHVSNVSLLKITPHY